MLLIASLFDTVIELLKMVMYLKASTESLLNYETCHMVRRDERKLGASQTDKAGPVV